MGHRGFRHHSGLGHAETLPWDQRSVLEHAAAQWRWTGCLKISRKVYYREADIQSWLDANRYTRTDQPVLTADKRSTGVA